MEVVIDCYFDKLFGEMERNCLASRHKRRQLVKYFSDVINSCAEAEDITRDDVCERIVQSALRYHNISMSDNGSVCLLGKFHNVLYVAAKLCYDWNLGNNEIVSRLLNDIFYCERTFERIFVGAIFGTRVTHFLSGWKSDFDDRDENIKALIYFMDHAVEARLQYRTEGCNSKRRFIDVPMESYGQVLPLRVAIQHGSPDILEVMLRYGASTESDRLAPSPVEILLTRLNEYDVERSEAKRDEARQGEAGRGEARQGEARRGEVRQGEAGPGEARQNEARQGEARRGEGQRNQNEIPENLVKCLRLVLRTVPNACIKTPTHIAERFGLECIPLHEQFPNLIERKLVPADRGGLMPPELIHLCRCRIRDSLFENWALPHGIQTLQIPVTLRDYLDLKYD